MSEKTVKTTEIQVHLLNRIFKIDCPYGQDANLYQAVSMLNSQLTQQKSVCPNSDFEQHLTIVALNMANELASNKISLQKLQEKLTSITSTNASFDEL